VTRFLTSYSICFLCLAFAFVAATAPAQGLDEEETGETEFKLTDLSGDKVTITKLVPRFAEKDRFFPIFDRMEKPIYYGDVKVPVGTNPVIVEIGDKPYPKAKRQFTNDCAIGIARAIAVEESEKNRPDMDLIKVFNKMSKEMLPPFFELNARFSQLYPSQDSAFVFENDTDNMQGGKFYLKGHDRIVTTVQNNYVNIIPVLSLFRNLAETSNYTVRDRNLYEDYVKELVERYDGDGIADYYPLRYPIKIWQFEESPAYSHYQRVRENFMLPSEYLKALKITRRAMRTSAKEAQLVLGAMTASFKSLPEDYSTEYLKELASLGVEDYYDMFAMDFAPASENLNVVDDYIRSYRQALGTEKNFIVTSLLIGSAGPADKNIKYAFATQEDQARNLVRFITYFLSRGAQKVLWARMKDEEEPNSMYKDAGLIDTFGQKKVAFHTYLALAEKINGDLPDDIEILADGDEGIYAFKFNRRDIGKDVFVLWKEPGK